MKASLEQIQNGIKDFSTQYSIITEALRNKKITEE
jgi:hypothetical protein